MLEAIKGFVRECKNRVREDEVIDRLSYNTWKTCNRILEEVEAQRQVEGKELPTPSLESIWFWPKMSVRHVLTMMYIRGEVEIKHVSELTSGETAWASTSDSDADQREVDFRANHGFGELAFYKLIGNGGRRKNKEDKEIEGAIEPMIVTT